MPSGLQPRLGYLLGFLVCAGMIGFALYLQHFQGQEPCPLCILQRIAWIALGTVFLVAAIHGPARIAATVYGVLLVLIAGVGAAIAGRHVWLQNLPRDQVPACGPDLDYMLRQFPLSETLRRVLSGTGECAESGWALLGLSIAGWSLVWLILIGAFAAFLTLMAWRRARSR
ncbi:MAG TPA: disulfide bond formation protein B [Burkholderiales bacterium]|jgi:disulfide bond formation protein DsbB|nr:disulfide bond formation protein B [Burkholderiales bacterium]